MNISNLTRGNREPDVISNMTDYDIDQNLYNYLDGKTRYEFAEELNTLYVNAIKSIKKYGGFYIGRYETGDLSKDVPVVRKMNEDIATQTWYTMYNKSKRLSNSNENVTTSMIFGSLFDETLEWLVKSGAKTSKGKRITYYEIARNSTSWGNYKNSTFSYIPSSSTIPDETSKKAKGSITRIPAGSSEYTKVNNIYDIAGNVWKRTIESGYGGTGYNRVNRASGCNSDTSASSYRSNINPYETSTDYGRFLECTLHKLNAVS